MHPLAQLPELTIFDGQTLDEEVLGAITFLNLTNVQLKLGLGGRGGLHITFFTGSPLPPFPPT